MEGSSGLDDGPLSLALGAKHRLNFVYWQAPVILSQEPCHPERSESASGVEGSRAASLCRVIFQEFSYEKHHGRKEGGREILRCGQNDRLGCVKVFAGHHTSEVL